MLFSWKGGIRLIDEDVSRRTIAVSIKATKLTGRVLAQACLAVGRKIKKAHRARQTPHGKQTVRQLMGHGAATNSIEVESPKDFDRVARKWNVDYARKCLLLSLCFFSAIGFAHFGDLLWNKN